MSIKYLTFIFSLGEVYCSVWRHTYQPGCLSPFVGIPCTYPNGTPDELLPGLNVNGTLDVVVTENNRVRIDIEVFDVPTAAPVTAWLCHITSWGNPNEVGEHPVYDNKIAEGCAPLARTDAAYTSGRGSEPNLFDVDEDGHGTLRMLLDYNPFQRHEAPMRAMSYVSQEGVGFVDGYGDDLNQELCCPRGTAYTPIGAEFLRLWNQEDGKMLLDDDGRPELARSPMYATGIRIVVHCDFTTHGIAPGVPMSFQFGVAEDETGLGDHFRIMDFWTGELGENCGGECPPSSGRS